jgi:Tol biopolymer transport system component
VQVTSGVSYDEYPRWSLDGTRLAFLRPDGEGRVLVVADAHGRVLTTSVGEPFREADSDTIAWSSDGGTVAIVANDTPPTLYLMDSRDGTLTTVNDYSVLDPMWRPPDGRQLMVIGGGWPNYDLRLGRHGWTKCRNEPGGHQDRPEPGGRADARGA